MIRRLFGRMLGAQIASVLAVTVCMVIDSIIIGRFLGVNEMAAYGLANPVLLVFTALSCLLSNGVQVAGGKVIGAGDRDGTNRCYSVGVALSLAISAIGIVLIGCFCTPLCRLLGAEGPILTLSRNYILGFIPGIPATFLAQIFIPFMQFGGKRNRLAVAVGVMTVCDIAFDLLNVLVFHGGMFGMAVASSLSYYAALLLCAKYFTGKKALYRFSLKSVTREACRKILRYGIPVVVSQIAYTLLVFSINRVLLLTPAGTDAVAAYSAVNSIANIYYSIGGGIGSVALTLGAIACMEKDKEAMHETVRTLVRYALILDALLIAVIFVFARMWIAAFYPDGAEAAMEIAVQGLRIAVFTLLFSALNSGFKNYYQGIGEARLSEIISILTNALTAGFAFLLVGRFGEKGVFSSFIWGEGAAFLCTSVIIFIKNKKIGFNAPVFSLSELIEGADAPRFTTTITEEKGVLPAAQAAQSFCLSCSRKNTRTANVLSLCIEEICSNIFFHGFTDGKPHSIDILLLQEKDKWLLRFRDDGKNFDPMAYLSEHAAETDPTAHIGIRLVMRMVTEADYKNSLGLNNLTLVL